ncbi:TDP-N-acetylfucosamine:lipid II N-acetylfucosaminyltransferase [Sulfurovum sp.]|uniref:TDP-N-acetylfucosamine:lipid II N-acetylfucosaminyltransferase n=1 Tax=Sulfurovum sp. TaxID=1969726 RepID=UPI002867E046|nr:TDP-N-acetylfucosamine:lipid II N-acetylfucosaminyltransferase [Sulfurovum sp.]
MKSYKIVHIINNDKFIKPFMEFIENNFEGNEHLFVFLYGGDERNFPIPKANNVININNKYIGKKNILRLAKVLNQLMLNAEKVILHGLFSYDLINYLYLHQKFLKKCYWVMWGGDLYSHVLSSKTIGNAFGRHRKKTVIRRIVGLITYIKGDYELAQKWYGAQGEYYECFMYPSNLYKEYGMKPKEHSTITIQVGNSADPTNNHIEVFNKLEKYKYKDIKIIVPLSYGNQDYAKEVIEQGKKIFGVKLVPLTEFIPFDKYLDILSNIDIAIFNHNRQQAMGNIITLLGLGKKVYMRHDITPWKMFEDTGINVFDVSNVKIDLLSEDTKKQNQQKVKEYFSKENYLRQLDKLFEG